MGIEVEFQGKWAEGREEKTETAYAGTRLIYDVGSGYHLMIECNGQDSGGQVMAERIDLNIGIPKDRHGLETEYSRADSPFPTAKVLLGREESTEITLNTGNGEEVVASVRHVPPNDDVRRGK